MTCMEPKLNFRLVLLTVVVGVVAAALPSNAQVISNMNASQDAQKSEGDSTDCLNPKLPPLPKNRIIRVGSLNTKVKEFPQPEYPEEAKVAGVAGVVKVNVVVDVDGRVVRARVISGHPLLREAVKKVVCRARFPHAFINGTPIWVSGILKYRFTRGEQVPPNNGMHPTAKSVALIRKTLCLIHCVRGG